MIWNFFFIFLLVALNGFFVAAEFAVITARKSRVRLLAEEGNTAAKQVLIWLENFQARDRIIAAAQLGITIVSLALGAVGENTFDDPNYGTIAGYVLGLLDHIPVQGETIMLAGNIQLQVVAMDGLRISQVQIQGV